MNRREFITAFTQTAFVGIVALGTPKLLLAQSPVQIEFKGKLLKGTEDGQIQSSDDNGLTWTDLVDFGPDCQVQGLYQSRNLVFARINYLGHTFVLRSTDGEKWLSKGRRFFYWDG